MVYVVQHHFQQYFSYIVAVSFSGGGNRSTRRKPPTFHKSMTKLFTYFVSSTPRHQRDFKLTTLVVIGTDCTFSCKSDYHTLGSRQPPPSDKKLYIIYMCDTRYTFIGSIFGENPFDIFVNKHKII